MNGTSQTDPYAAILPQVLTGGDKPDPYANAVKSVVTSHPADPYMRAVSETVKTPQDAPGLKIPPSVSKATPDREDRAPVPELRTPQVHPRNIYEHWSQKLGIAPGFETKGGEADETGRALPSTQATAGGRIPQLNTPVAPTAKPLPEPKTRAEIEQRLKHLHTAMEQIAPKGVFQGPVAQEIYDKHLKPEYDSLVAKYNKLPKPRVVQKPATGGLSAGAMDDFGSARRPGPVKASDKIDPLLHSAADLTREITSLNQNRQKMVAAGYKLEDLKSLDDTVLAKDTERAQIMGHVNDLKKGTAPTIPQLKKKLVDLQGDLSQAVKDKNEDKRVRLLGQVGDLGKYISLEESGHIAHPALLQRALSGPGPEEEKLPWYEKGLPANLAYFAPESLHAVQGLALGGERALGIQDPALAARAGTTEDVLADISRRGGQGFIPDATRTAATIAAHFPAFAAALELPGGIAGEAGALGLVGAAEKAGEKETPPLRDIGKAFVLNAAMVPLYKGAGLITSRPLRMATAGAGGAAVSAIAGQDPQDIATSGIFTALLAYSGKGKANLAKLNPETPPAYMNPVLEDMAIDLVRKHGVTPEVAAGMIQDAWHEAAGTISKAWADDQGTGLRQRLAETVDQFHEAMEPSGEVGEKTLGGRATPMEEETAPGARTLGRGTEGGLTAEDRIPKPPRIDAAPEETTAPEPGLRVPRRQYEGGGGPAGPEIQPEGESYARERPIQQEGRPTGETYTTERSGPGRVVEGSEVDRLRDGEQAKTLGEQKEIERPLTTQEKAQRNIDAAKQRRVEAAQAAVTAPKQLTAGTPGKAAIAVRQQDKEKQDYASTQANLPATPETKAIKQFAKSIPTSALAEQGREESPHITVKYGLHGEEPAEVQKLLADEGPVTVTLGKTSVFKPSEATKGAEVLKVDVHSPDLERLNKKISDALPHTDTFKGYTPHVTIAYLRPGQAEKYAGKDFVEGKTLTLNSIAFSDKSEKITEIPLEGKGAVAQKATTPETPKEATPQTPAEKRHTEIATRAQAAIAKLKPSSPADLDSGTVEQTRTAPQALTHWDQQGRYLAVNPKALGMLRNLYGKPLKGVTLDSANAWRLASQATVKARDRSLPTEERSNWRELSRTLQHGASSRFEFGVGQPTSSAHELSHVAQFAVSRYFGKEISAEHAEKLEGYQKVAKGIVRKGYNWVTDPRAIAHEAAAHIIAGQHEELGLTDDEAKDFLARYMDLIGRTYKADALSRFDHLNGDLEDLRDDVRHRLKTEEAAKEGRPVQAADRGAQSVSTRGASGARQVGRRSEAQQAALEIAPLPAEVRDVLTELAESLISEGIKNPQKIERAIEKYLGPLHFDAVKDYLPLIVGQALEPPKPAPAWAKPGSSRVVDGETVWQGKFALTKDQWKVEQQGGNWEDTPEAAVADYRKGLKQVEAAREQEGRMTEAAERIKAGNVTDADIKTLTGRGFRVSTQAADAMLRRLGLRATDARTVINTVGDIDTTAGGANIYDARDLIAKAQRKGFIKEQTSGKTQEAEDTKTGKGADTESTQVPEAPRGGIELSQSRTPSGKRSQGEAGAVVIPGQNKEIPIRYAVREMADVYPSHDPMTFQPNPKYQWLNDRHYEREKSYQQEVMTNSKLETFSPKRLLNNSDTAEVGPPIIDMNGNVLGGNSRAMMLARYYQAEGKGQKYKAELYKQAAIYGIDLKDIVQMKQPILVREVSDEALDAQASITELNVSGTRALTPQERSVAEAGQMKASTVDYIAGQIEAAGPEATLSKVLDSKGPAIVEHLIEQGVFQPQERNALIKEGGIQPEARRRIESLLIGRIFRDLDQMGRTPAFVRQNIERAAPSLIKLQNDVEWDLTEEVRNALDLITDARAAGIGRDLEGFVNKEGSLFQAKAFTPREIQLGNALQMGPIRTARAFRKYAAAREPEGLFAAPVSSTEAFVDAFGGTPEEVETPSMFSLEKLPTLQRAVETMNDAERAKLLKNIEAEVARQAKEGKKVARRCTNGPIHKP
jgi:2'-5' RNA ligase